VCRKSCRSKDRKEDQKGKGCKEVGGPRAIKGSPKLPHDPQTFLSVGGTRSGKSGYTVHLLSLAGLCAGGYQYAQILPIARACFLSQPGTLRRSVGSAQAACGGRESKPRCKDAGDGQGDRGPAAPFPVASGCKPAQPTTETLTRDPCRSPWASGPLLYPCAVVGPALEPILTGPMGASVPPTRSHTESFEVSFPFSCSEVARTAARFAVEGTHTHTHTLHVRGY
jgi:hypothetical protein